MKKTLITFALLSVLGSLILSACVKKEDPEKEHSDAASQEQHSSAAAELQPLEPTAPSQPIEAVEPTPPKTAETEPATVAAEPASAAAPVAEAASTGNADLATHSDTSDATTDDAIAAAIKAAQPALDK
jgi:PBP1b-binding outer membrane lipoprotein LpoB